MEHCLGWTRDHDEQKINGVKDEASSLTSPLLRYLVTCSQPQFSRVKLLCDECDVNSVKSSTGQGPLHLLLTSNPTSASLSLVTQLVRAGVKLDQRDECGNTPLLCLQHLLDKGAWTDAAALAQFLCTQTDCDVNSGKMISIFTLSIKFEFTRIICCT